MIEKSNNQRLSEASPPTDTAPRAQDSESILEMTSRSSELYTLKLRRKRNLVGITGAVSFIIFASGSFLPESWAAIAGFCLPIWIISFAMWWRANKELKLEVLRHRTAPSLVPSVPEIRGLQRKYLLFGITAAVSFMVSAAGNFVPDSWTTIPLLCLPVFFVSFVLWWRTRVKLGIETRRYEARPISIDSIEKAPVLYLRSFNDDEIAARSAGDLTEEEYFGQVFSQIGPFVAVGRPGEALPQLGASRLYIADADWQSRVERLMRSARLVIIRIGLTAGLSWELDKALRVLSPERLVIFVHSERELHDCLAQVEQVHPQIKQGARLGWGSIGTIRGIIVFNDNWQASGFRWLGWNRFLYEQENHSYVGVKLASALQPVFRRLGTAGRSLRINHFWFLLPTLLLLFYLNDQFGGFVLGLFLALAIGFVVGSFERVKSWTQRHGIAGILTLCAPTLVGGVETLLRYTFPLYQWVVASGLFGVLFVAAAFPGGIELVRRYGLRSWEAIGILAILTGALAAACYLFYQVAQHLQ